MKAERSGGGHNVPLEVTWFMSCWIAAVQRRKTIDAPTTNALLFAVGQMREALASLERILTTPIPWSYCGLICTVFCYLVSYMVQDSDGSPSQL